MFGEPYRNKKHLTTKEMAEVKEWERTTKNMWECGHCSGLVIEFWPGEIIYLGYQIGRIFEGQFEIFTRVGDWRCYDDEQLLIEPVEAELWLLEIDELVRALNGFGNLPHEKVNKVITQFFHDELGREHELKARLDEITAKMPFAPINSIRTKIEQSGLPDLDSTINKIKGALTDAAGLCHASIETGNPIRLLW